MKLNTLRKLVDAVDLHMPPPMKRSDEDQMLVDMLRGEIVELEETFSKLIDGIQACGDYYAYCHKQMIKATKYRDLVVSHLINGEAQALALKAHVQYIIAEVTEEDLNATTVCHTGTATNVAIETNTTEGAEG